MDNRIIMDYIENNLGVKLTHSMISSHTNYSKYHFHRLFHKSAGNTVMNYVRMRRVIRSRYEIINRDKNLIDIAYDYGFHNYDRFTRTFKKIYGITPIEYRNYYHKKREEEEKENDMIYVKNYLGRISECQPEAKKHGLNTLIQIIKLSELAFKKGLLAIENEEFPILKDSKLFKVGIELLLNGTEPRLLNEILSNFINSNVYLGKDLIERVIISEGLLDIQQGKYPWEIKNHLVSILGEDYVDEINSLMNIIEDSTELIKEYLKSVDSRYETSKDVIRFEKSISVLDTRSLQRMLREIDLIVLCTAIEKVSQETQDIIIGGLPKRKYKDMIWVYGILNNFSLAETLDSQNEILSIINELRVDNEIV